MEIFDKIGDAASKTYKFTAEKTSKFAKETKIKMKINEHKGDIKDLYIEIGEAVYQKFVKDEELDMEDLQAKCEEIQNLSDKIVECKNEILKLKEKRQCKNCYEEIEINANYCPNCGFEQEKVENVEIENAQNEEEKVGAEENTEEVKEEKENKEEIENETNTEES